MKKIFFLFIVSVISFCAYTQTWQDTAAMIEKIFERLKPGNPGCQLAINRNGQVIFSKAWGMADLEHAAPLTTASMQQSTAPIYNSAPRPPVAIQQGDLQWTARFLQRFSELRNGLDKNGRPFRELAHDSGNKEIIKLFE